MRKNINILLAIQIASLALTGCDENSGNEYETRCTDSGGEYNGSACVCNETACAAGIVCHKLTGECQTDLPTEEMFELSCTASGGTFDGNHCICDETICNHGYICDFNQHKCSHPQGDDACTLTGGIPQNNGICECNHKPCHEGYVCDKITGECSFPKTNFESACVASGGTFENDICTCGNTPCDKGATCVWGDSSQCLTTSGEFCTDGDTKCINGNDDIGETYTCISGKWQRDKEIDDDGNEVEKKCSGSCNRSQTACGESGCQNYISECRDDLLLDSTRGGAIGQCQFGKWQIQRVCAGGASCNKETGDCGECMNNTTKCENHEINGIMNKNCVSDNNCELDSNGNLKYYPATIGVQLLCYDGRWSDYNDLTRSVYCPPVSHTFQQYYNSQLHPQEIEMTKVYRNSSTKYDDYHYSSCHNTETISECGQCNNIFNICSDELEDKLYGHMQRCTNGVLVYGNYCDNKTKLCANYSQCK